MIFAFKKMPRCTPIIIFKLIYTYLKGKIYFTTMEGKLFITCEDQLKMRNKTMLKNSRKISMLTSMYPGLPRKQMILSNGDTKEDLMEKLLTAMLNKVKGN